MPKMKTKSSAKKRFKITGSGKIKRKHAFKSHILTKKSKKRKLKLECTHRINEMEEINGKADIIRWEILYEYGGVFLDADSICIEPIDI